MVAAGYVLPIDVPLRTELWVLTLCERADLEGESAGETHGAALRLAKLDSSIAYLQTCLTEALSIIQTENLVYSESCGTESVAPLTPLPR